MFLSLALGFILLSCVFMAGFLLRELVSFRLSRRLLHYPRAKVSANFLSTLIMTAVYHGKYIAIQSESNVSKNRTWAVLLPGSGESSMALAETARFYFSKGMGILLVDYLSTSFRRGPLGWGPPEARELAEFLSNLKGTIVLHGKSFGSSVALLAWKELRLELHMVLEAPFSNFPQLLLYQSLRPKYFLRPFRLLVQSGVNLSLKRLKRWGIEAGNNRPEAVMKGLKGKLLLIHGTTDRMVRYDHSLVLQAAAQAEGLPVKTVLIPYGRHSRLHETNPTLWEEGLEWITLDLCGK